MLKRLIEWWKWCRKDGWTLVEVERTNYQGWNATKLCPYFWQIWRNDETGEIREVGLD